MQPLIATFDPYDQAETKTWLDAFAELEEEGPQGNLDFANAGVIDFEFVSGHNDEWVNDLKDKMNEQLATSYPTFNPLPQIAADLDATDFVEADAAKFQQDLVKDLQTSMAYGCTMLKEDAANNWASSFMSSMDGGKYFRPDSASITTSTFDTIYIIVVGTRLAYILIQDED
jgi:hypothetical protein